MENELLFRLSDLLGLQGQILLTLLVTALACAVLGVFLLLRRLSMVTDALSHSILLGIVLAYLLTKDLSSPWLLLGAGLFGIFTVFAIESLSATRLVKNDDAVGILFPLFFSLAVLLISRYARNVHLDVDVVLMGEAIMIPLNTWNLFGLELPKAFLTLSLLLVANLLFIRIFFKELKLSTFDPDFARVAGFSSLLLFYGLMGLSSFTAVAAFDAVGAMLVISFFVAPASAAYLLSKDLKKMLILSALYALLNTVGGFFLAMRWNVSISGMIACFALGTTLLTLLFHPGGLLSQALLRNKKKRLLGKDSSDLVGAK